MLDGEPLVIDGIGFAGVKGFGGGFDAATVQPQSLGTWAETPGGIVLLAASC